MNRRFVNKKLSHGGMSRAAVGLDSSQVIRMEQSRWVVAQWMTDLCSVRSGYGLNLRNLTLLVYAMLSARGEALFIDASCLMLF